MSPLTLVGELLGTGHAGAREEDAEVGGVNVGLGRGPVEGDGVVGEPGGAGVGVEDGELSCWVSVRCTTTSTRRAKEGCRIVAELTGSTGEEGKASKDGRGVHGVSGNGGFKNESERVRRDEERVGSDLETTSKREGGEGGLCVTGAHPGARGGPDHSQKLGPSPCGME